MLGVEVKVGPVFSHESVDERVKVVVPFRTHPTALTPFAKTDKTSIIRSRWLGRKRRRSQERREGGG